MRRHGRTSTAGNCRERLPGTMSTFRWTSRGTTRCSRAISLREVMSWTRSMTSKWYSKTPADRSRTDGSPSGSSSIASRISTCPCTSGTTTTREEIRPKSGSSLAPGATIPPRTAGHAGPRDDGTPRCPSQPASGTPRRRLALSTAPCSRFGSRTIGFRKRPVRPTRSRVPRPGPWLHVAAHIAWLARKRIITWQPAGNTAPMVTPALAGRPVPGWLRLRYRV